MEGISINKIENGFLVSKDRKVNGEYTTQDIFCKNVAQVVKLIKLEFKQPEQVPF